MQMRIEIGKRKIYLCHYPFLCFEGGYKDVWQLFGHVHTRKINTGIDAGRLQYLHTIALFVFRLVILAGGDAIELLEEGGEGGGA